ncbi:MAG: ankyrin repeat domain-containing protein [Treponema sp.]|nr:ankyrin repeat domain-containing protein [Treponema sp.]
MTETIYSDEPKKNGFQLISASEKGDVETVKSLLKKDIYIHTQDRAGRCALVAAAYKNHLEIVDLLISAGINQQTHNLRMPLSSVSQYDCLK